GVPGAVGDHAGVGELPFQLLIVGQGLVVSGPVHGGRYSGYEQDKFSTCPARTDRLKTYPTLKKVNAPPEDADGRLTPAVGPRTLLGGLFLGRLAPCFLALVPVVLPLELLDPAGRVHVLHLAGKEGMASRADFDGDVFARAAGDELIATATGHGGFHIG